MSGLLALPDAYAVYIFVTAPVSRGPNSLPALSPSYSKLHIKDRSDATVTVVLICYMNPLVNALHIFSSFKEWNPTTDSEKYLMKTTH